MKIIVNRETLLKPLQQIGGVVERRQTLPILSNVLINASKKRLHLTATDLEVELRSSVPIESADEADFTLPARKLIDICKALPEGANIEINLEGERATLRSGRSRFTLSVLPAVDFPNIETSASSERISLAEGILKRLIDKTQFAMAHQDVRYYLNGLFLEIKEGMIRAVTTDGHRLALSESPTTIAKECEVILPRKAVMELGRLLSDREGDIEVELSSNHARVHVGDTSFTTKLIDGKFPDYRGVLPRQTGNVMVANREELRQALQRASILSNEKYRGIRFRLRAGMLELQAHNPEQEEAEEEIEVQYKGDNLIVGFNVGYLIDVLSVIQDEEIEIRLADANSSCLIQGRNSKEERYVVMPMRL